MLPRPVYRAYDVGAVFNEDYVDLMYRLARRDLLLYLYDSNNQPVRDAGRLIVSANRWGVTESLTLSEGRALHQRARPGGCVLADPTIIPHQVTLFAADAGQVLKPDMVHEARLVPLLMHEDFSDGLEAGRSSTRERTRAVRLGDARPSKAGRRGCDGRRHDRHPDGRRRPLGAGSAVDVVILTTDTARPSKTRRVLTMDNTLKQVTLDGAPGAVVGSSAWTVPVGAPCVNLQYLGRSGRRDERATSRHNACWRGRRLDDYRYTSCAQVTTTPDRGGLPLPGRDQLLPLLDGPGAALPQAGARRRWSGGAAGGGRLRLARTRTT